MHRLQKHATGLARAPIALSFLVLLLALPSAAQEDGSLVGLQGLDALRALEAEVEAGDEERTSQGPNHEELQATYEAEKKAEAARKRERDRLQALISEEQQVQARLVDDSKNGRTGDDAVLDEANPRIAPGIPEEREMPIAIFDREDASIAPGTWGNSKRLKVMILTLDADGNGKPELKRWVDRESKLQLRREEDRNYDGVIDAWGEYEWGEIVSRVLDSNDDGNPDVWERYADARMTSREVDRDDDGVRDAFYKYNGDAIVEERHDSNNDGQIDRVIIYERRLRVSAEEDQDTDGRMDTWTTYTEVEGKEVVTRIERDERGEGSITMVELFDTDDGKAVISRKDEDINGDGEIDVISIYQQGKLVRREISDPKLIEL